MGPQGGAARLLLRATQAAQLLKEHHSSQVRRRGPLEPPSMAWKRQWKKWDWPTEEPKEVKQLKKDVARSGASSSAGSLGEDAASLDSNLSKKDLEERMTSLKKMK